MTATLKALKRAILSGQLRYGANALLQACFGKVTAGKDPAESEKFKKEQDRGRIYGALAVAMTVARILANKFGPPLYGTMWPEGFLFI